MSLAKFRELISKTKPQPPGRPPVARDALAEWDEGIREARRVGLSYKTIARLMVAAGNAPVGWDTIRRYCRATFEKDWVPKVRKRKAKKR